MNTLLWSILYSIFYYLGLFEIRYHYITILSKSVEYIYIYIYLNIPVYCVQTIFNFPKKNCLIFF